MALSDDFGLHVNLLARVPARARVVVERPPLTAVNRWKGISLRRELQSRGLGATTEAAEPPDCEGTPIRLGGKLAADENAAGTEEDAQAARRSASSRLSHPRIRFQLAKFRVTTFPQHSQTARSRLCSQSTW